jgi:hypothetical protein
VWVFTNPGRTTWPVQSIRSIGAPVAEADEPAASVTRPAADRRDPAVVDENRAVLDDPAITVHRHDRAARQEYRWVRRLPPAQRRVDVDHEPGRARLASAAAARDPSSGLTMPTDLQPPPTFRGRTTRRPPIVPSL